MSCHLIQLLYGCESWTPYHWHIAKLYQFHLCCLRNTHKNINKTINDSLLVAGKDKFIWKKHSLIMITKAPIKAFQQPINKHHGAQ